MAHYTSTLSTYCVKKEKVENEQKEHKADTLNQLSPSCSLPYIQALCVSKSIPTINRQIGICQCYYISSTLVARSETKYTTSYVAKSVSVGEKCRFSHCFKCLTPTTSIRNIFKSALWFISLNQMQVKKQKKATW